MTSGAPIFRRSVRRRWLGLLECSSLLLGLLDTEVDDTQDDSWRGSFMTLLYLVAKPSHVGVDVDRLAYPLHRPTVHSCQMREQGLRLGIVLSLQQEVTSFGGCEAPRARIFGGELIASVPTIPNLTWGKSLLPSWHLGVYSWCCYCIRQRWDRFSTQVYIVRCTWAPMAMSIRVGLLWSPLADA
jgi:hypothetical protein